MKNIIIDPNLPSITRELIEEEMPSYNSAEKYLGVEPDYFIIAPNTRDAYTNIMGLAPIRGKTDLVPMGKRFHKEDKLYLILSSEIFSSPRGKPIRQAFYCHELAHSLYDHLSQKQYKDLITRSNSIIINDFLTETKALECAIETGIADNTFFNVYLQGIAINRLTCYTKPSEYISPFEDIIPQHQLGFHTHKMIECIRAESCPIASSYIFNPNNENQDWIPEELREYFDRIWKTKPSTSTEVNTHSKYLLRFLLNSGVTNNDIIKYNTFQ